MSYSEIDPIINEWVQRHALHLFKKFADDEARFVYVSSCLGECFQIAISTPHDGHIRINARAIETRNDEEISTSLVILESKLGQALDDLLHTVQGWMKRHDHSATRVMP